MPAYALFLRAVNVGGTGKLPMADLRLMLSDIGTTHITTYIASDNAVCHFDGSGEALRSKLETALETYAGKPVGCIVLTQPELDALLTAQPFEGAGNQILCLLLDHTPTCPLKTKPTKPCRSVRIACSSMTQTACPARALPCRNRL